VIATRALDLALISAAVLGFRHGFDYDHIAAISDITSVERGARRAMRMGLVYVTGHAATIAALGGAVIAFQRTLPARIDGWAERAVGLTLIVLGVYVLGTLLRRGSALPKSRGALLIGAVRWMAARTRALFHWHDHRVGSNGDESKTGCTSGSVFVVGVIHGLGAETPSQLLLFLLAANLGGVARGFLGLGVFLAGLVAMNTLMTAAAVGIFGASAARPRVMRFVTGLTAAYSVFVGAIFLFGSSVILPRLGS
jgi:high-affinity nickel-transport protein